MRNVTIELPMVDEEYPERLAVYTSALIAPGPSYHVVEMGARWGTWGSRAISMLRAVNPMPFSVLYYEPQEATDGLVRVQELNGITNYTLVRGRAETGSFREWVAQVLQVNLLDVDIQEGEAQLIPEVMDTLDAKVVRLVLGTHSPAMHKQMSELFKKAGWRFAHELPFTADTTCVRQNFRRSRDFAKIIEEGCYEQTRWGPICQYDGELVLDNPRFDATHSPDNTRCLIQLQ